MVRFNLMEHAELQEILNKANVPVRQSGKWGRNILDGNSHNTVKILLYLSLSLLNDINSLSKYFKKL